MAALNTSALLLDALHFASAKHRGQTRQDADASPFVNHPIETAWLLAGVGGVDDTTTLVSAVLHDVLEDTPTTPAEIEQRFGSAVRRLVEEVTDRPARSTAERRQRQVARMAKASLAARQIRLADKIANVGSLPLHWSWLQREEYLTFAEEVAGAARGANPHLDERFLRTLQRARVAHMGNRRASGPAPPPAAISLPQVRTDVPRLGHQLRLLQSRLSKAEELVDAIVMDCGNGRSPAVPDSSASAASARGAGRKPRRRRFSDPAFRRLAEPGVGAIDLQPLDARHMLLSIDGARPFRVSSRQAALVAAIAFVEGASDDGFTPFQSLSDVAAAFEKKTGRRSNRRALTVAIARLRELFHARGQVNPLLVETCRTRGVRLRLRRPAL
jgi:guanosine-3',5'-bis(diphosphate) 3'-pyrophosphohydrolase